METAPETQPDLPVCEPIADTGGIGLLPFPRNYNPRGAPFRIPPVSYLYTSVRVNQNVRKKFLVLVERMQTMGCRVQVNSASQLGPMQAVFTDSAQFPKWLHIEPYLRGDAARADGYKIIVNQDAVVLHGADETGVQYACSTLLQLIEDGPDIPGMEIDDYPLLSYRAVHLDFKGWPPQVGWLRRAIETLASVKINVLVLEYDAHFDYPSIPGLASPGALTAQEMAEVEIFARDCGVTLVPLVSSVGGAGHILAKPEYAALREHPDYPHMFCITNTDAANLLIAQMNDLIQLHTAKMLHLGGDGAFLLGSNPSTIKRAEDLGGIDAVYLDYLGLMCRFLITQGVQPLLWDESLRNFTDDQIKWLPNEIALTFHLPEGVTQNNAADVLAHLERYKVLGKTAWGAAQLSPAHHYSTFDNIDGWAEIGELGYIKGFMASIKVRDQAHCALLPPFETIWPAALYAAERAWSGKTIIARELFPQRFIVRFYGMKGLENQSRMWAGCDAVITENFRSALTFFKSESRNVNKNAETALFMESWSALQAFLQIFIETEAGLRSNFAKIQDGSADTLEVGRLRARLQELKSGAPQIIEEFSQHVAVFADEFTAHEFIESAIAYTLRRLDEIEPLLADYPLPAEQFCDPLGL